jgi:recombination protein RecR
MADRVAGPEIERLVQLLARLPGLGPRSARRAVLHLIRKREELLAPLAEAMRVAQERIVTCSVCGNIDVTDPCTICRDPRRDPSILVIVETVADLWALERAGLLHARYHVLGGVLSPLDGVGPDDLNIASLVERVRAGGLNESGVREAILAVNATVDGQTTAHYLADLLAPLDIKTTRLAHGVPVGGELDYLDEGTLAAALERRTVF